MSMRMSNAFSALPATISMSRESAPDQPAGRKASVRIFQATTRQLRGTKPGKHCLNFLLAGRKFFVFSFFSHRQTIKPAAYRRSVSPNVRTMPEQVSYKVEFCPSRRFHQYEFPAVCQLPSSHRPCPGIGAQIIAPTGVKHNVLLLASHFSDDHASDFVKHGLSLFSADRGFFCITVFHKII